MRGNTTRGDGTQKGSGFLGGIKRLDNPDDISSELSIGVDWGSGEKLIPQMVPTLDDNELLSDWNFAYENYGFVMSRFSSKWEKEYIKTSNQPKPEFQTLLQRIESLETRIGELEKEKMSRFKSIGF